MGMTTSIEVNGLQIFAHHGVYEAEQRQGNNFEVSLRVDYDFQSAMENDTLEDTINYADLVEIIKREMRKPSKLLENVAYRIRRSLQRRYYGITGGQIRISKLTPPIQANLQSVSISITWQNEL